MRRYRAILFDLFDTLVDLNYKKLPLVSLGGSLQHSTGSVIYCVLQEFDASISRGQFMQAFDVASQELEASKKKSNREIASEERIRRLLERVHILSPPPSLVEEIVSVHMDKMFETMEFPPERRRILEELKPYYKLALVSNFDHPPTAYRLLKHYQLSDYFESIVISAEVGWRKPGQEIFAFALAALDAKPGEALHVGDTLWADVRGAKQAGLDVAWLNPGGQPLTDSEPRPDYILTCLDDLLPILQLESS